MLDCLIVGFLLLLRSQQGICWVEAWTKSGILRDYFDLDE